jgi:phage tail-like protein
MSTAAYLPKPPQPPHDPRRLPLDARTGWQAARLKEVVAAHDGALTLAPIAGSIRRLNEANGAFGGLTMPTNVAVTTDGSVLLLDQASGTLKRFDPCRCRFETVPCTGGIGSGPRQVLDAGGIGVSCGNLFIADAGNARLQIYGLHGFVLRGFWRPPAEQTGQPWLPVDVAFASHGRVLVADPNNGCVHLFNAGGCWLGCVKGTGAVNAIATDRNDRLYVFVSDRLPVAIFDLETGEKVGEATRAERVADGFARLPVAMTAAGLLELGALCLPRAESAWFDLSGAPAAAPGASDTAHYSSQGTYLSTALDSHIYRCQWDRLQFSLAVPNGTRVKVHTFTAETELTLGQIEDLSDDAWATRQTVFPSTAKNSQWDCLVRSEPGRFLWLRLELLSDGERAPKIERILIDFPRISLRRYLPAVFAEEPVSADFTDRFLAVFDRGFRRVEGEIDHLAHYFDPLSAPAESGKSDFLSWLASWIGVTLNRQLPLARRRRIVKEAGQLFKHRGTVFGLRRMLELYLGLETRRCIGRQTCAPCTATQPPPWQPPQLILEHFKLRRWLFLGTGRLGDQATLWGQSIVNRSQLSGAQTDGNARLGTSQLKTAQDPFRDPFHLYAHTFSVFLPGWIGRSESYRTTVERLIGAEKPAHTNHRIVFVEPRFRIGIQSMIGFDSVIGCYPSGVAVNESRLGKSTVLDSARKGGPQLRVGDNARIGTTTQLS